MIYLGDQDARLGGGDGRSVSFWCSEAVRQRHAPTWREVILLVAGHFIASGQPGQARTLAWALLAADAEGSAGFYRSAVLAGEIVEELGSELGREGQRLKDDVAQTLAALVQGGHLPAKERVEAALLLGRLGDPRLPTPDQADYWCAVAAGAFWYGDETENEELQQVELPYLFKIARYAVTNAEYQRFIEAGGYDPQQPWWTEHGRAFLKPGGHQYDSVDNDVSIIQPRYWNNSEYNSPTQPIVALSWYEAAAYANWLTVEGHAHGWLPQEIEIRLPTSLEWERAARHTDQRRSPWAGVDVTPEHANCSDTDIGRPAPVGCFPVGVAACGAQDMVGNTQEWLAADYTTPEAVETQKECTPDRPILCSYNDFRDESDHLCCDSQFRYDPFNRNDIVGFRVLWSLARGV